MDRFVRSIAPTWGWTPYFNYSPPRQERPISSRKSSADVSTILEILVRSTTYAECGIKRFNCNIEPSDGLGEFSDSPRALKEGEIGEWILLDGVSPSALTSPAPLKTTDRPQPHVLISHSTIYTLARSTFWYACSLLFVTPGLLTQSHSWPSNQLSGPNLGRNTSCESVT